jgi:16S rRNA (cytosine1402-N4)-methyltransferase
VVKKPRNPKSGKSPSQDDRLKIPPINIENFDESSLKETLKGAKEVSLEETLEEPLKDSPGDSLKARQEERLDNKTLEEEPSLEKVYGHEPVMAKECMEAIGVKEEGFYIDATMGGGGHSRLILKALGPQGRLLALDVDNEAVMFAKENWAKEDKRIIVEERNFKDLTSVIEEQGLGKADGILADLGISHRQLKSYERGFSFSFDGPLDMRLSKNQEYSAWDLVNKTPINELANIIYELGEERRSRQLAREIVRIREKNPINTTKELANLAYRVLSPPKGKKHQNKGTHQKLHPATRLFMALRIEVNDELGSLKTFLQNAYDNLKEGGILTVISFHSLEDRLVKELFRKKPKGEKNFWEPLSKKPIVPSEEEIKTNPRARSAKLRAAKKLV